jgi:hypothetical protein
LSTVLFIINYFLLFAKKMGIFKSFEDLSIKRKLNGQIYFWIYVILSFVIAFIVMVNFVTPKY